MISLDFFSKNLAFNVFDCLKYIFNKWYRFLVKIIGPIIFYNLLVMFGNGPNFNQVKSKSLCQNNFWKDFLFINNFTKNHMDMVNLIKYYKSLQTLIKTFIIQHLTVHSKLVDRFSNTSASHDFPDIHAFTAILAKNWNFPHFNRNINHCFP